MDMNAIEILVQVIRTHDDFMAVVDFVALAHVLVEVISKVEKVQKVNDLAVILVDTVYSN